ncbi:uncharacterized protein LOC110453179 [Mizuhopecten yessoensis]|uniref:uncharacterized protein LOC110453179 n=1 Tax=Mizuhopecten yessoensis TaxID=6573 RepID=UPI000B458EAA|nr:uncharacterized protein LOC110453179 [Mizuhopecten yessoensis]
MGHKVSRHKSYAVCRVDGLPGQYRVIRPADSYGSQLDNSARSYGGKYPNHDRGVTADRKYVTAINDIGSQGIRSQGGETKSNGAISPKSKPKPKPRKKKDVNLNEKINTALPHQEQPCPSKHKESPKKERDSVERKSNGSTISANATLNQRIAQNGHDSHGNETAVLERRQRVVPRASSSVGDERKQKVNSRVNSSLAGERKQRTIPPANLKADDARQQHENSLTVQHQYVSSPRLHDTKSPDNEPIPVSNVDSPEINRVSEKSNSDVEISLTDLSADALATKTDHEPQMILSQKSESTTNPNKMIASDSVVKDCDASRYTLVSVVVHQPFAKPEPSDIPKVVLNGGQECLSDQEEVEQETQVMFDDEPVNVAMFERVNSARNSQVKKSVAFSDDCVDIEHDLSQSYSRNGFHEKMDNVYGTTVRQNNGDKWVTLDATDATEFALIQRQKVPGQSILKKSKHPRYNVPALNLKEPFDKSAEFKTVSNNKKSISWDHIEDPSNIYPQGMVPVPAPRGRMKGFHRPHNEEMSKIKASNGTLADYIKQKSTNSYEATKQIHINPTLNGVNHSIVIQNGGQRPQVSRGHVGDMSPRYVTSPRTTSTDPRSRTLSPSRTDERGRLVVQDGHVRKVVNGIDPAVHYMHSPRGEDNATSGSRSKQRQGYPPKQQSVKLVVSSGKHKPSNKKQHTMLMEQPKQQRNMIRQQWMVGNL